MQYTVASGASLQAALDMAQSGDEVVLEAGATFQGTLNLTPKGTPDVPVIVRGQNRPPDRRVTAADASVMPKLVSGSVDPTLTTEGGGGYRFQGIEFLPTEWGMYNMIYTPGSASHLGMDRCVFMGGEKGQKNAIGMNGAHISVEQCHIANIWAEGEESHGFVAWDGPGPYTIRDNYIEAGSIGILFGGADSSKPEWMPADILIEDNLVTKQDAWRSGGKAVKNALELKTALRVIIRRNRFEKVWTDAQGGSAILFTVRNQDGRAPWSTIEDVLFTQNEIAEVENGLNIGATNDTNPSGQAKNIRLYDNVWQCSSNFGMVGGELTDLWVERNTIFNNGTLWVFARGWIQPAGEEPRHPRFAVRNFTFRDNLAYMNEYGVFGDEGIPWQDYIVGELNWTHNALANRYGSAENQTMPGTNWYPTKAEHELQFEPGTTQVRATSQYQHYATDGGVLGNRIGDYVEPEPPIEPPIEPEPPDPVLDRIPPDVDIVSVVKGPKNLYVVTVEATDNVAVTHVEFLVDDVVKALLSAPPYVASVKLTKGHRTVTARAYDEAGNTGEASWSLD